MDITNQSQGTAMREMPLYECHKKVWALKIAAINDGGFEWTSIKPVEEGYGHFEVDRAFMDKHKPVVGGYYVVYEDGYKSFSPAQAFEAGYTLIK